MTSTLIAVLIGIAVLDLAASIAISLQRSFTTKQKALQLAMIWLIPVIGAVVALVFTRLLPSDPFAPAPSALKPGDGGVYENYQETHTGADHH